MTQSLSRFQGDVMIRIDTVAQAVLVASWCARKKARMAERAHHPGPAHEGAHVPGKIAPQPVKGGVSDWGARAGHGDSLRVLK